MRQRLIICCITLFLFSISLGMQASDLQVSEITLSSTNWGRQTASIDLSNSGENYSFVVAISEVRFTGGKYESPRFTRRTFFIEPSSKNDLKLPITISAGYGKVEIDIFLYEVIDTLDQLFDSQRFFTKSFPVEFKISENLKKQIVDEIKLPKFVEDNILFDNYFSRALMTLIQYEKTTEEIAELCQTDTDFIKTIMKEYQEAGLINIDGSTAAINFMAINKSLAEAVFPAVKNTVEGLFKAVSKNYASYDSALVSMVSEGKLSADKNDALDLATILYQKYPVTLGLLLWDLLGREFINDSKPFDIFEGSDPCNAVMGDFMYMMVGADNYSGDSYYYSTQDAKNNIIYCGLGPHNFKCFPGYRELARKNKTVSWAFDYQNSDIVYLYNEDKIRKPMSILMDGTNEHIENLKVQMDNIFAGTFYDTNNKGARYWCWNLVVTRLMKKFEDENIFERDNTQLYRLQVVDF